MNIEIAQTEHANDLSQVLVAASEELRGADFNEEGWNRFMCSNTPDEFSKKIANPEYLILICSELEKILGFISIKDKEKIDQLFVLPEARKRGVSSALWLKAKTLTLENGAKGNFWVRSSGCAVPVYQKFGFRKEGDMQDFNGIRFQFMRLSQ